MRTGKLLLIAFFGCISLALKAQTNCADIIYVTPTGNAVGSGTTGDPVTLDRALQLVTATRHHVKLLNGNYAYAQKFVLPSNTVLDGRYKIVGGEWVKSSNLTTTLNVTTSVETQLGTGHYIAFQLNGVTEVYIKDISIVNLTNAISTTGSKGRSVYGIHVANSSGFYFTRDAITTGNASSGANGVTGAGGATGGSGATGHIGDIDGVSCNNGANGNGGFGAGGGGGGGAGATTCNGTTGGAVGGSSGVFRAGGGGGGGGAGGYENEPNIDGRPGGRGGLGGGGAAWGNGGGGGNGSSSSCSIAFGGSGQGGQVGVDGANASAAAPGYQLLAYFVGGNQAAQGSDGAGGGGGGGGGGGSAQADDNSGVFGCVVDDGGGSGGGGGGGGGQGGQGGFGGFGGGGTFGIYAVSGNSGDFVHDITVSTGALGSGGAGGAGGIGGNGGPGGSGGGGCGGGETGCGSSGGLGGKGGNGGLGQTGGSGLDANAQGVSIVGTTIPNPTLLDVTMYGGCTNSEIVLVKGSGTWTQQASASYINDLNATTSSYTNASATAIIGYTSTGHKDIVIDGINYEYFVYIRDTRALPTFDAAMGTTICEGDNFLMSTPTSGTTYEWLIFDAAGTTSTPVAIYNNSVASWPTPVTGVTTNYSVRLRIKEDCCGWSVPVYFNFTVVSNTVGPLATGATICADGTADISATGTGIGNLVWYSDPLGQIVLQSTPGVLSNFTTPVLTQNTVFYVSEDIGGCASAITSVPVDVNQNPNTPTTSTSAICEGSDVLISGTGSGSGDIIFYDNTMTQIGIGTMGSPTQTYNGGALAAGSYTYFITESDGTCESNPVATSVVVNPAPSAPTAVGSTLCEGESTTISATGTETIYWYADAGLTNQLSIGSNYTTGPLSSTTTYYLSQTDGNGCESTSSSVTVTVNPAPADPVGTGATICEGETATISATSSGGTSNWYNDPTGSNLIGTGSSFTTGVLNQSTSFYVQEVGGLGCESNIIAVLVTVNNAPNSPSTDNIVLCEGTDVILSATGSGSGDLIFLDNTMTQIGSATMGNPTQTYNAGPLAAGNYTFYVLENDGACNSNPTAIPVAVDAPSGSPTIAIQATSSNICQGAIVTFTSTVTNEGPIPTYQWYLNGNPVGGNNSTFSMTNVQNGDQISVSVTSNEYCLETPTSASNTITMTVNPNVTPSMVITADASEICAGNTVNFNSSVLNEGVTPIYDWFVNGVSQANNAPTFSSATLNDGDVITASLVSDEACASPTGANSNGISITVNPLLTPTVSIDVNSTTICEGSSVTFTASATDGGTNAVYQWYVNGNPVGSNNSTFTTTGLVDGDVVNVILTSSENCVTTATATSGDINMSVQSSAMPTAFITTPSTIFCAGDAVTFTSSVTNEGGTPMYEWYLNGVSTGITTTSYTNSSLNNGDVIELILTSSMTCAAPAQVMSNSVTMLENASAAATVSIAPTNGVLCENEGTTFIAFPNNASSNLNYEWSINGIVSGSNNAVFNSGPLASGDVVGLLLIYDDACSVTDSAYSNVMTVSPIPVVDAGLDVTIFEGENTILNGQSDIPGAYLWSPASSLDDPTILNPIATPASTTEYELMVTSASGCVGYDYVLITIDSQDLGLNNSFSPNDDGINDTWTIDNIEFHPNMELKIFNRWGNLLYEQYNTYTPWDGNYKGQALPSETYYYILILEPGDDALKGSITIVR